MADGDRLDTTLDPAGAGAAAHPEFAAELFALGTQYATASTSLRGLIADAVTQADSDASWAQAADHAATLVAGIAGAYMQRKQVPAEEHPKRLQTFLQGLPAVALMPTTEARAAGFTSLLQGLVG